IGKTACERRRKQSHRRPGTKQKPERFRPYAARRQERRQEGRRDAEAAVEGAIEKQKAGQHISSNAHARRSMSLTARRLSPREDDGATVFPASTFQGRTRHRRRDVAMPSMPVHRLGKPEDTELRL